MDSEIWPNLIINAKKNKVPLAVINARITRKSSKRWLRLPNTAEKIFKNIDLCLSSNKETQEFLLKFNKNVFLTGNIKLISKNFSNENEKKCCVIELICNELSKDELTFDNEQYRQIYDMFEKGIEENVLLTASYFKKLENQSIVSFVSSLESNEIELSYNWIQKYNIYTKSESDNLYKSVMNSIYNFKYHKVDELLLKIKNEIKNSKSNDDEMLTLLGEQMSYERIKKMLSDKLGRIILK